MTLVAQNRYYKDAVDLYTQAIQVRNCPSIRPRRTCASACLLKTSLSLALSLSLSLPPSHHDRGGRGQAKSPIATNVAVYYSNRAAVQLLRKNYGKVAASFSPARLGSLTSLKQFSF